MKSNQIKIGAILSYISFGIGVIASIIYTPIMIRLLGKSDYGLYNLASSIISYLGLLNLGFGAAYIKYFSLYKKDGDNNKIAKLNGVFLIIFSILGLVVLFSGLILSKYSNFILGDQLSIIEHEKSKVILIVLSFNMCISIFSIVFTSYITSHEKFIFQQTLLIIKHITSPLITYPVLLLGYGSVGLAVTLTLLNIIIDLINIFYAIFKLKLKLNFKNIDSKIIKDISIFSSFIFLQMIADRIIWSSDKVIIGHIKGTDSVAVYSVASTINNYFSSLSYAFLSVFTPRVHLISQSDNANVKLSRLFSKVARIQFIFITLIVTGFIFFGKPFITWWVGEDFIESYFITLALIIPFSIELSQHLGREITRAKNLHKYRSYIYLSTAVINIFISIPLVKLFDGIGAAIGTGISILICNVIILNIFYIKKVHLNMKYFWKEILKIIPSLIVPLLFGYLFTNHINIYTITNFIFGIIAYTLVYIGFVWILALNKYEKRLVIDLLKNIIAKAFSIFQRRKIQ